MKQIMIDSSTLSTLILILKKVHRFLFRFLSMHERKLWKKKMIDVQTKKKTKKLKFLQRFFTVNICIQLSNLFDSECPILICVVLYLVNLCIQLYILKSKNLTYMKLASYLNSTNVTEVSTILIFYSFSPKSSINIFLHSYSPQNSTNHFQFMRVIYSTNNYEEQHLQISIRSLSLTR